MGFHLAGYSQSQDSAGVLVAVNALVDQFLRTSGKDIVVPKTYSQLIGAYAGGATITLAQLQSPSLRRMAFYDVRPLDVNAAPPTNPSWLNLIYNPYPLDPSENLEGWVAEGAAGAELEKILVWLGDGNYAKPAGQMFTVRATGTTTVTANVWSACTLTFSQTLAAGEYAIVGARFEGATAIAGRFAFPGGGPRPGHLGMASAGLLEPRISRGFSVETYGEWGRFAHDAPPLVEMLCTAADTAQTIHLDLIKTA